MRQKELAIVRFRSGEKRFRDVLQFCFVASAVPRSTIDTAAQPSRAQCKALSIDALDNFRE